MDDKIVVIKDMRTGNLYLDNPDEIIRSFEEIIDEGNFKAIFKKYPNVVNLSRFEG